MLSICELVPKLWVEECKSLLSLGCQVVNGNASPIKRSILEPNEINYTDEGVVDSFLHSFEERALASGVFSGQERITACEFEWTNEDFAACADFFKDPSN